MGTIKDLMDLTTQLANSVQDRRISAELNAIQSFALEIQSQQANLHEANVQLREEAHSLQKRNQELESEVEQLRSVSPPGPTGVPTCPNCSTTAKPLYMRPVPPDFVDFEDTTHECPKCGYGVRVEQPEDL